MQLVFLQMRELEGQLDNLYKKVILYQKKIKIKK